MEASSKTASSGASGTRVVSTSPSKDNSVAALLRSFEGAVFGVMELMQRKVRAILLPHSHRQFCIPPCRSI